MGKMALLLVLSLSVAVGVIAYTMNLSKKSLMENVSGFDKYSNARNIAHTGVNMMLRRLDAQDRAILDSLVPGKMGRMHVNMMGGRCDLTVKLANPAFQDTVELTSKAYYMDTVKSMKLRLRRQPVPFPVIGEAVGLHIPNVNFIMSGTPYIDGRNHDVNGNLLPSPPDTNGLPGVGVIDASDTTKIAAYGTKIDGTKDYAYDPGMSDPGQFVDEYIDAADTVLGSGTYNSGNFGTQTVPRISYLKGNVKFNGNLSGWGILIVEGNLTLAGTFQFHGLVLAHNDTQIDVQFASGTPDVYGAIIAEAPSGSSFTMKGNSNVAYSKDALNLAKYISKLQWYKVLWWYE